MKIFKLLFSLLFFFGFFGFVPDVLAVYSHPTSIPRSVPFEYNGVIYDSYVFAIQAATPIATTCSNYRVRYFAQGSNQPFFIVSAGYLRFQWGGYTGYPVIQYIATGTEGNCYFQDMIAPSTSSNATTYSGTDYPITDYIYLSSKNILFNTNNYDFGSYYDNIGYLHTNDVVFGEKTGFVPTEDSILTPASGSYLSIGQQTFSGECTHPGLHYAMNWRDFNYPTTPTITCEDDYTWSTTYEVLPSTSSTRAYYLYNYETEQSIFVDVFGTDLQTYLWGLSFLYPDVDSSAYAKLKISSTFPFRLKYNLPQGENKNDYDIAIRDTSSGTLIVSYPLSSSDSDSLGYIEKTINVVSGINDFSFSLMKGAEEKFAVAVNWEGVADVGVGVYDSTLPDKQDLGFWGNLVRTLFVPRFGFIDTRLTTMSSDFSLHFGNFSELKNSFVSVLSSVSDTGTVPSGSFTWHGWNLNVLNFNMMNNWISTMKGIEIAVLWVLTFFVILRRLSTIFSV